MCHHDHEALKRDPEAWSRLPLVGIQRVDGEPDLELRNCECRSTLAIELPTEVQT